jgi:hypothetical protein
VTRSSIKFSALYTAAFFSLVSCSPGGSSGTLTDSGLNSLGSSQLESYSPKPSNFRVSLTDAPSKELKSVFVNVLSAEVWLKKDSKEARVVIGKNIGLIDLMTLRNGVLLPLEDFKVSEGIEVSKIRLILGDGNYAIKGDDTQCSLQTPSAQQSGIKISLSNPVTVVGNNSYSLVVDFDAQKSVVIKGNGDCLLKPVLKIASFTKIEQEQIDDDGTHEQPGEDLTGGNSDSNTDSSTDGSDTTADSGSGFDSGSGSEQLPEIIDPDMINSYLL